MLCPNDSAEMHQVKMGGHYGEQIIVDQCEKCGGIWFDEAELFRAKQGEAEKIEALNTEILRTPSVIENSTLFCPRSGTAMHRFTDKYFPQDIVLVRCPLCHGIWLNRGLFTKYQQFRYELMRPKKKSIAKLMKSYESGRPTSTLRRLGEFSSTGTDSGYTPDFIGDVTKAARDVAKDVGIALNILFIILKLIFKF